MTRLSTDTPQWAVVWPVASLCSRPGGLSLRLEVLVGPAMPGPCTTHHASSPSVTGHIDRPVVGLRELDRQSVFLVSGVR